ncbi:DUF3489 domain-containing protein [Dankookia sp. GCM10030260]|uniref:DUF3489 domain-containing protein n=1 Tax=Dankookia sp. GCM10030260 TaxID=3273390 RepID=UPI0036079649
MAAAAEANALGICRRLLGTEVVVDQHPASRATLRDAAQRVLLAWDDEANPRCDLADALRALPAGKPAGSPRDAAVPRKPREGTKHEAVLTMLRGPEGATVAQVAETTGWTQQTVRGFFAGLKK